VTEHKQAESALQESEENVCSLAESAPVLLWMSGTDTLYTFFNQSWLDFTGRTLEQELGNGWLEGVHPEDLQHCIETYQSAFSCRQSFQMEYRLKRSDGEYRRLLDTGRPRYTPSGSFAGYTGSCIDISDRKQTEEALRNSQLFLHSLFQSVLDAIVITDDQGRYVDVNPAACKLLGLSEEELLGRQFTEFIEPGFDFEQNWQPFQGQQSIELRLRRLDGTLRVVEYTSTANVLPHRHLAILRDITLAQQAQEELQCLQDHLEQQVQTMDTLLCASPDHFYMFDRDGRFIYASRAGLQALGLQKSDIIGKTESELGFPPELIEQHKQRREAVIASGETLKGETSVPTVDGVRQHEYMLIPIPDASGIVQVVVATSRDITEQRQAQEQLRQYRQHLEELVAARTAELASTEAHLAEAQKIAHIGSWEFDVATGAITWSDEVFRIFGLNPNQPAPTYSEYIQLVHPDDREILTYTVQTAIAQGKSYQLDHRILRPDSVSATLASLRLRSMREAQTSERASAIAMSGASGSIRHVNSRGQVNFNSQGQVIRLFGTVMDITERKQAEEALRESEERFRQVFVQAPIGIVLGTPDGKLMQVNQAFCQMLGYTEAELMALNFSEITHPEDLASESPYIEQILKREICRYQLEKRYFQKNGDILFANLTCGVVRDQQGNVMYALGMVKDITERKQAEQEIQRQTRYQQLLAEISLRIRESLQIEVILQTTVTELQQLLQADRVIFYRLWPNRSGQVVAEAVVPEWPSTLERVLVDQCFEDEYLNQYQQEIHAWSDVEQAGFQPCHLEMLRQFGIRADLIVPILLKDKLWGLLFVHQCSAPRQWNPFEIDLLRQLADQLSIALAQAELLEQETCHSQELARSNAELEQFAYVASHDLQEPLRTLASYAKLLSRRYSGQFDEKGNRFIQYILEEALRMQALINDLLRYSRVGRQGQNFAPTDCMAVFNIVVKRLAETISNSGATVTCGELPTIMADEMQLVQLFQNLISNAIKYRSSEPPVVQVAAQHQEGQWVFSVRDNGIGIEPQYAGRIFVIFQRLHTQEEYSGTGIGLAIAAKIVERHGGQIWVESALGQGATFYFTIPEQGVSFGCARVG
jgi:PAS domain S-box-containing protein